MRRTKLTLCAVGWVGVVLGPCARAQENLDPGAAAALHVGQEFRLENHALSAVFSLRDGKIADVLVTDRQHKVSYPIPSPFTLVFKDGTTCNAPSLHVDQAPTIRQLDPTAGASRFSDTLPGAEIAISMECPGHALPVALSLILRDGSSYLRQSLTITAVNADVPIRRVQLIDLPLQDAHVVGTVNGSPIVAGNVFVGFEHPLSQSKVENGRASAWIDRDLPLRSGQSITYSAVMGFARQGQMRRDFLAYIERERAHPYRTFLHYNSWYDLGYFSPYDQAGALDRVNAFGRELSQRRGVKLDSFLFDDGWDDHKTLWKFNSGFPEGFTPIRQAAAHYDANPGVWMSPWGGYSKPKQERVAFGRSAGYEIIGGGYALSGPKYYAAFRDVCLAMIRDYGVNQFKFDGTGNVDSVFPGSQFDSDFSAAIHLIGELRATKPDIYINLTTGTWPSPFWLFYADSIWRGGEDDSYAGVGTQRERWITYRDEQTYQHIVESGPLFPLNSLMLHGMIFAQHHKQLNRDPGNDFHNEVRSYFGAGTQLQEMYITPSLLSPSNWDDLAESAKWSRANADVLKDTHWVGGDPARLAVYGWASWTPRKGILVLRNPSDKDQSIAVKLQDVFELPPDAKQAYRATCPWKDQAGHPVIVLEAHDVHEFCLAPFEVLTLDILPEELAH
ncbi:MAG TPA: enterotoxin [Terracidiphilus sp.]|nr:enterotoxin [Terracidiphilus sp.]